MLVKRKSREALRGGSLASTVAALATKPIDRRSFLSASGLAVGGLAAASALGTGMIRKAEAGQTAVERHYTDLAERTSDALGNVARRHSTGDRHEIAEIATPHRLSRQQRVERRAVVVVARLERREEERPVASVVLGQDDRPAVGGAELMLAPVGLRPVHRGRRERRGVERGIRPARENARRPLADPARAGHRLDERRHGIGPAQQPLADSQSLGKTEQPIHHMLAWTRGNARVREQPLTFARASPIDSI